jgi:hypothetical protein
VYRHIWSMPSGSILSLSSLPSLLPAQPPPIPSPAYMSSNVRSALTNHVWVTSFPFPTVVCLFSSFPASVQRQILGLVVQRVWNGVENFS